MRYKWIGVIVAACLSVGMSVLAYGSVKDDLAALEKEAGMEDCRAGKIDRILTKSVSRFARNTVDSLNAIRELKGLGIGVVFEKENIFTLDSKGEFLITIMSSLSQEESRSISENVRWGIKKRMADGKYSVTYSHFIGYDREDGGQ